MTYYTSLQLQQLAGVPHSLKGTRRGALVMNQLFAGDFSTAYTPRRQRNAARWAEHRAKMDKKDSLRFGSYLYRPHPAHFKPKAKSPGVNESVRGERIWAKFEQVRRGYAMLGAPFTEAAQRRELEILSGMGVKL